MNKAKIEAMKNCLTNFTRMHLEGVSEIVIYDKQGRKHGISNPAGVRVMLGAAIEEIRKQIEVELNNN